MLNVLELRQWMIGAASVFFLVALYYEVAKSLLDRIRRKMLSVGAVVFIIGSVFATISAQKNACPEGGLNGVAEDEIAELLIPSRMEDSALSRNVYGAEDDYEDRAVWSLTNGILFDSFALTATSRVFGIGWTLVGIGTGAIDERYHVWKGDENREYGFNKRGAVRPFEPGYVVADPSTVGSGHMGILDFDGQAISAGANCVNRIMDGCGSDLILRKYRR